MSDKRYRELVDDDCISRLIWLRIMGLMETWDITHD